MRRTVLAMAAAAAVSACSTVTSHTVEECDRTADKFIGIPISVTESCTTVTDTDTGGEIGRPE